MASSSSIPVTFEFELVIRRASLDESDIPFEKIIELMEEELFSQNEALLCFGPSFGIEALETFIIRLKAAGLEYYDDFYELQLDHPAWLRFEAFITD